MKNILLDILAFGTLISATLVITSVNPVISVIYLIAVFINAAGYLIVLGIGFIGISYIIVYVGAITVLFLFVIMMINIKLTDIVETGNQYTKNIPLLFAIALLFTFEAMKILPFSLNNVSGISALGEAINNLNVFILNSDTSSLISILNVFNPTIADTAFTNFLQIQAIGQGLYTYGAVLLIICSVILLLAMVAPIFISRKSNIKIVSRHN
jgi:NADH-ubiquinone oxidoreductase chain 6